MEKGDRCAQRGSAELSDWDMEQISQLSESGKMKGQRDPEQKSGPKRKKKVGKNLKALNVHWRCSLDLSFLNMSVGVSL